MRRSRSLLLLCFFFNDTATTEIYTLSLHDALPICRSCDWSACPERRSPGPRSRPTAAGSTSARSAIPARRSRDRKSTRLNSSHGYISYAVFCLKKKKKQIRHEEIVLELHPQCNTLI